MRRTVLPAMELAYELGLNCLPSLCSIRWVAHVDMLVVYWPTGLVIYRPRKGRWTIKASPVARARAMWLALRPTSAAIDAGRAE